MKVECTGKIVSVTPRVGSDGMQNHYIEIDEGDQWINSFRFTTKDPTLASQCVPGSTVTLSGFGNGSKQLTYRNALGETKAFKFPRFDVYFRLTKVTVLSAAPAPSPAAVAAATSDLDIEDII